MRLFHTVLSRTGWLLLPFGANRVHHSIISLDDINELVSPLPEFSGGMRLHVMIANVARACAPMTLSEELLTTVEALKDSARAVAAPSHSAGSPRSHPGGTRRWVKPPATLAATTSVLVPRRATDWR